MDRSRSRANVRLAVNWLRGNRLLRSNAIYLGGTLAAGALGYVFHFASGRLLGPAGYAVVASAVAATYIVTLPAQIVQLVAARFTSLLAGRDEAGRIPRLLRQLTILSVVVGLPIAGALVLFRGRLAQYLQVQDSTVVVIVAAASLGALLVAVARGGLLGMRRFVGLALNGLIDMAARVGTVILLAGRLGALGGLLALVFGPAIAFLHGIVALGAVRPTQGAAGVGLRAVGGYAAFTALATIGTTYLYNADVLLTKHYLTASAAGLYAAASVLGRVVYFLGLTVTQVMFPEVATLNARNESHYHVVNQSLALLLLIAAILVIAYALVPGLILLPYGDAFRAVEPYLAPFAVALSLLAMANLMINYFLSIGSGRFILPLVLACGLETVLISLRHDGPGQVLEMVITTMALLSASLLLLYMVERASGAGERA